MLKKKLFDKSISRVGTDCYKWDFNNTIFDTNDLIPLWVADMDFRSSPEVIKALKERAEHGVYGYTFHSESFYQSILRWLYDRHQWKVTQEQVISTPGVVPGINMVIQTFTDPGDKIIYLSPVYDPFLKSITGNNRNPVSSDLQLNEGRYEIDFADFMRKCKDAKMLLFCSPHNPVGRVWTQKELEKVAEICIEHEVLIVSDEIHSDLIFSQYKHLPLASLSPEINEITITFNAPSKTFNIAGLSTSYAVVGNKTLRNEFQNTIGKNWLNSGNIFGMLALQTAYNSGEEWLKLLIEYLEENFNFLVNYFSKQIPQIKPVKIEGTYLAWLDCRQLVLDQRSLEDFFVKKAKVGLMSGENYGKNGKGFMRLNFGCPRQILEQALERIATALVEL